MTASSASVKISDVSASRTHHYDFSFGDIEVSFSSDRNLDISVGGDFVVAAGTVKANHMQAFSVYDYSTDSQISSGIVSNLFVAIFVGILGLFGVAITCLFLALFSYVILAVSIICVFFFLYRFLASLVASILIWRFRRTVKEYDTSHASENHPF